MITKKVQSDLCFGCGACAASCPKQAIDMKRDEYGFLHPFVDEDKCINCSICENNCPALKPLKKEYCIKKAYTARSIEAPECASGGAFYNIIKNIKEKQKDVFVAGTVWNKDFLPEIILTNDLKKVQQMRGSKYVNGGTGTSYIDTLEKLKKGITVIYSGTPCQISGLYSFLGKDYENLITIEILCHGGGSPLAWQKYVEYVNQKYNKKLINCKMQNAKGKITLYFSDQTSITEDIYFENEYVPLYMSGKIRRKSCDNCPFMGRIRNADIIIGDVWAKWASKERKKGISLLIPNSKKAESLLKSIKWKMYKNFDINNKKNAPLNKINNNIPPINSDREKVLTNLSKGMNFEHIIQDKKVALMNFNYPRDNYGALLLAFALEHIVKKLGYEPYTINYYKNPITMKFNPQGAMWKFRENFLNLYGFATQKKDLIQYNNDFNKIIFGSDIIWKDNREYVYFADWCTGNKTLIAYAASFGENKIPKKDKYKIKCFQRFDAISVREKSAIKILKDYANVPSTHVIDPSLLLSPSDYQEIIDKENSSIPEGDYIAYYTFWKFNPYDVKFKMPVYNIWKDNNDNTRSFGTWLNMIKHAKFVITASFHGVCFCLLYNKPFAYILKPNEDNERINSLFDKFNLDKSFIVKSEKDITPNILNKQIDWNEINNKIQTFREESLNWLKIALEIKPTRKKKIKLKGHKIKLLCMKILSNLIPIKKWRKKLKKRINN